MMGRLNHDQEQLLYSFHLDEAVPHDHPVRKIAAVLDLSWVHSDLAPFYPKMGRPSRAMSRAGTMGPAPHKLRRRRLRRQRSARFDGNVLAWARVHHGRRQ